MTLRIVLSPHGRVMCAAVTDEAGDSKNAVIALSDGAVELIRSAFERSSAEGLLLLAEPRVIETLPSDLLFWRDWARQFFQAICSLDEERLVEFAAGSGDPRRTGSKSGGGTHPPLPDDLTLAVLIADAPPMRGLEYLTPEVLKQLWAELSELVRQRGAATAGGLAELLRTVNPFQHLLGRVTFHLADRKSVV